MFKQVNVSSQNYTSAATSINAHKLPAVYKYDFPRGAVVVDYGCGRYVDHISQYAAARGFTWCGYDPFNRSHSENLPALNLLSRCEADYVVCANVLNVIDSDTVVNAVIDTVVHAARVAAVFTVYEGNRTGRGRVSGKDQYQRNERRAAYVERIRAAGYTVRQRGDLIIVTAD